MFQFLAAQNGLRLLSILCYVFMLTAALAVHFTDAETEAKGELVSD